MEEHVIDKQQEGDKVSKQFDQNFKNLPLLITSFSLEIARV